MVKKTREFHDNENVNISGESIGGAVLIYFFVPYAALIRENTVSEPDIFFLEGGGGGVLNGIRTHDLCVGGAVLSPTELWSQSGVSIGARKRQSVRLSSKCKDHFFNLLIDVIGSLFKVLKFASFSDVLEIT